jgi:hypothetical protein
VKVVSGSSLTRVSTGLPQCTNLGTSKNLIRAKVYAATGAKGSESPTFSGSQENSFTEPHLRRKDILRCQPSAIDRPRGFVSKNSEIASSLSQAANIVRVLNCTLSGEKIGDPNSIGVRHSA